MKCYDGIHWNIYDILPYQRCFNFIASRRTIGKTYSGQMYIVDKCINRNVEFVYVVRGTNEIDNGVFKSAFEKVLTNEFGNYEFEFTNREMYLKVEESPEEVIVGDNGKVKVIEAVYTKIPIGHCIALSEARKKKRVNYPNVKYMLFDEYILEGDHKGDYYMGYEEPYYFLLLYETIDRNEDRVVAFFFGNTAKFYNPYHIYPTFNIQDVDEGKIWTSENVLFQRPAMSDDLKKIKEGSKFGKMIMGTEYGDYSMEGLYNAENFSFIEKRPGKCRYMFTINYNKRNYGIWYDTVGSVAYVSNSVDLNYPLRFALKPGDHGDIYRLANGRKSGQLRWLNHMYENAMVRFETMEIKERVELVIIRL